MKNKSSMTYRTNSQTLNRHYANGTIVSEYEAQLLEDKAARMRLIWLRAKRLKEYWS